MKFNTLYKSLLLLSFVIFAPAVLTAQEAEFVRLDKGYILHADGSQEFRCDKELKIFTHTAMNGMYGETFIIYNPDFQELKIHNCYTKQKDGTIIKTPENAFVEVLPRFAADAPAYNHLKEMVVVHTGLDLGSTIYLDYSILTKPGYYPGLDIDEVLQETSPVREYKLSISVPEGKTFNSRLYASDSKAVEQTPNGVKTYTWKLNNIPASSKTAFLPANKENIPRLTANTYADATGAIDVLRKQASESLAMESETYAQFITEESASAQEKADKILEHVVKNISTVYVPLQYTGYKLRSADEVIRSAYGTELEKVNLLNKMLNAARIPTEIIIYYPATIHSSVNGLAPVKQTGVKTVINGQTKYLSATGMKEVKPELRGDLDVLYTLKGEKVETGFVPEEYNSTKEITLDIQSAKNGYLVYTLPATEGIDSWNMTGLNSKRNDMLEVPAMIKDKINYIITLPEGVQLTGKTEPVEISNPQGKLSRAIRKEGNKVEVTRSIELNKKQYSPAEYAGVRALISEWNSDSNKQLVFKIK